MSIVKDAARQAELATLILGRLRPHPNGRWTARHISDMLENVALGEVSKAVQELARSGLLHCERRRVGTERVRFYSLPPKHPTAA